MLLSSDSSLRSNVASLICVIALVACGTVSQAQTPSAPASGQSFPDHPILRHGDHPAFKANGDAVAPVVSSRPGPTVAPGLALPGTGRVWALDTFEAKPQLVHLMYFQTTIDRHAASNFAKVNLAPFIAKAKMTVELRGTKAAVRLHELTPTIFIRCTPADTEDAALDPTAADTHTELAIVKLEVHGDKRLVNTLAFTQVTGRASRSESSVEIVRAQIADSQWQKITPKNPLAPGEYGLVALPQGQNLVPTRVFDFAIDPPAAQNSNIVLPQN